MNQDYIYRYRTISDYSIRELLNFEVVASSVDTFNDPNDIPLCFSSEDCEKKLLALREMGKAISIKEDYFSIPKVKNFLPAVYNPFFNKIVDSFKKKILVGCFSSIYDNPVMWAHYSGNRTGFVIEYEREDIIKGCGGNNCLLTVKYNKNRFDITNEIIEVINRCTKYSGGSFSCDTKEVDACLCDVIRKNPNNVCEAFITKNELWSYEIELRIIRMNQSLNGNTHSIIGIVKPASILLGDRISPKDKYLLLSIAKKKDITVYEMYMSSETNKFGYFRKEISKDDIEQYLENMKYNHTYNF